jgi:phosphate transport system substrate-binding protein
MTASIAVLCPDQEELRMLSTSRKVGTFALAAALFAGACSSSGSTTPAPTTGSSAAAPSTAASSAPLPSLAAPASCVQGSTTAAGSTALQPVVDAAGKEYAAACSGATVSVQGGGSGTGLTQVLQGAVNIGNSDVKAEDKLKPDEASQLVDHRIAKQGWVMVVNPGVTGVTNLTTQQATDIWTGKTINWKDVGGNDQAIVLIIRPASSGTRATFKKIVLGGAEEAAGQALTEDSNGAVTQAVAQTPGATSVIGYAYFQANKGSVTPLQLDGVDASVDNFKSGTYKLQADGHAYTKGEPADLTKAFIDYLLSPDVQDVLLPSLGYAGAGQ